MLAIIGGSSIVFILGRRFGTTFVERFVNAKVLDKYEQYF
jgi:uncharacterized membrane protein YdjX (TVP38/TMEM64 family)